MNIGSLLYDISTYLLNLGSKLYEVFTTEVSIKWVKDLLNFFGTSVDIPNNISLYYILSGGSAIFLLAIIIYRIFK